jgi:hypothetical protein
MVAVDSIHREEDWRPRVAASAEYGTAEFLVEAIPLQQAYLFPLCLSLLQPKSRPKQLRQGTL